MADRRRSPPEIPPLSEEQEAVVDAVLSGSHLKVQAFAGSGKTTTLLAIARAFLQRYPRARILYVTFNRRLLQEAKAKLRALDASLPGYDGRPRIDAYTNHGLAFRGLGWQYRERILRSGSLLSLRYRLLQELFVSPTLQRTMGLEETAVAVLEGVTRFCQSADLEPGLQHLPPVLGFLVAEDHHLGPVAEELVKLMRAAWQLVSQPGHDVPWLVTHDVYLKRYQLAMPRLPYDLVLCDEAQDANPAMLAILLGQPAQHVFVGDEHQQIYAWRGAVNAMASLPWRSLPLTVSWRFGDAIARYATRLLQELKGETLSIRGAPGRPSFVGTLPTADAVLCRSNVGALHVIIDFLERGHEVAFAGPLTDLTDTPSGSR